MRATAAPWPMIACTSRDRSCLERPDAGRLFSASSALRRTHATAARGCVMHAAAGVLERNRIFVISMPRPQTTLGRAAATDQDTADSWRACALEGTQPLGLPVKVEHTIAIIMIALAKQLQGAAHE